jgi:phytoene desaturase
MASEGHNVSVLERHSIPGGKCSQVEEKGYRFDTGPSVLTMMQTLEEVFSYAPKPLESYLECIPMDPLCHYWDRELESELNKTLGRNEDQNLGQHDDASAPFVNYADFQLTLDEVERIAPNDVEGFKALVQLSSELYRKTNATFIRNPLARLKDLKGLPLLDLLDIKAFSTVSQVVDNHVESPFLRKFFKRFTTYNGSSPYLAPGTLHVIPHVELSLGAWYIKGGLYQLVKALEKACLELGVRIYYDHDVQQLEVKKKRIAEVSTSSQSFEADLLISNADSIDLPLRLASQDVSQREKDAALEQQPSSSGFVLLLGTKKSWPQLGHHNIFFSRDYANEFDEIFNKHHYPSDPTIYISNTSASDPDDAPKGGSNLFVLVNVPPLKEHTLQPQPEGESQSLEYADKLIDELQSRGLTGLRDSIEVQHIHTPVHYFNTYRSNRGAIYGTSSNSPWAAFLRPRNVHPRFKNLYRVGGSTHPGGGIPLVLQSALNATSLALDRL